MSALSLVYDYTLEVFPESSHFSLRDYKTHCNFPWQYETGVAEQVVVSSPTLQCWSLFGLLPQRSQITVFGAVAAAAAAAPAEVSAADEASSPTPCNSSSNASSIASAHTPTFVRLGTSTFRQQSLCPRGHKDKNKLTQYHTLSQTRRANSQTTSRTRKRARGVSRAAARRRADTGRPCLKSLVTCDLRFESQIAIAIKSCDLER